MKTLMLQLTLCMLCLQGLQDVVGLSVVHPTWQRTRPDDPEDLHNGWTFAKPGDPPFKSPAGDAAPPTPAVPDASFRAQSIKNYTRHRVVHQRRASNSACCPVGYGSFSTEGCIPDTVNQPPAKYIRDLYEKSKDTGGDARSASSCPTLTGPCQAMASPKPGLHCQGALVCGLQASTPCQCSGTRRRAS